MSLNRFAKNPILTSNDVPFRANSIFNAGAVKFDGQYLLLCRVEGPIGRSDLVVAASNDGYSFTVRDKPLIYYGMEGSHRKFADWGAEDPRITQIGNTYYILYTGYSGNGPVVLLASTEDFEQVILHGPITEPVNKDAVLFPQKIGGFYWKVDRPAVSNLKGDMWINRSPDLKFWGDYRILISAFPGTWESEKIGACTPPVLTDKGWLMLYHGVRKLGENIIYRIGVVLLDHENPWQVIGRSPEPLISPQEPYERIGDVPNVVFSCGWIHEPGGQVKIYYSGADTNICLAETTVDFLHSLCTD